MTGADWLALTVAVIWMATNALGAFLAIRRLRQARAGEPTVQPAPDAVAAIPETLIVGLTCETIGEFPDPLLLHATTTRLGTPVRVLMIVIEATGLLLAKRLSETGINIELLLGPDVPDPPDGLIFARMPPGTSQGDLEDFALGLSDVMMAEQARHNHPLVQRAKLLGKPVIVPGHGLPLLPPIQSVVEGLDPQALRGHRWRRHWAGRLEQILVEALGLFVIQPDPFPKRWARLRKCFRSDWCPSSYFAPDTCKDHSPDPRTFCARSPLVRRFDALDRSAVFGAYVYRDLAWIVHFGVAFAVAAAVVGAIVVMKNGSAPAIVAWGFVELFLLVVVAILMFCVQRGHLQDRWTACRLGAEQLRIARMCLPLLVLPRALITRDTWPGRTVHAADAPDLTRNALDEVKRAIRDHGLPRLNGSGAPEQAARWVQCIVHDQIEYHQNNHRKLERAERSLRTLAACFFFAAIAAVVAGLVPHLWPCVPHAPSLLLLTAAGPAFAAAFHGAATRLAIVHRIALSQNVERELCPIDDALTELMHRPELTGQSWAAIRKCAFEAADAMGRENQSWHGLVRLQRDTLPA